jgi:hypothetical protein
MPLSCVQGPVPTSIVRPRYADPIGFLLLLRELSFPCAFACACADDADAVIAVVGCAGGLVSDAKWLNASQCSAARSFALPSVPPPCDFQRALSAVCAASHSDSGTTAVPVVERWKK